MEVVFYVFLSSHKTLRVLFQGEVEIHLPVTRALQRHEISRGMIKPQGLANLNMQSWRQLQNNADKVNIKFNLWSFQTAGTTHCCPAIFSLSNVRKWILCKALFMHYKITLCFPMCVWSVIFRLAFHRSFHQQVFFTRFSLSFQVASDRKRENDLTLYQSGFGLDISRNITTKETVRLGTGIGTSCSEKGSSHLPECI